MKESKKTCAECKHVKSLGEIVGRCMEQPYEFLFCKLHDCSHACDSYRKGKQ